ncbi:hypothetical protein [Streptomyces sp. NPDC021356]
MATGRASGTLLPGSACVLTECPKATGRATGDARGSGRRPVLAELSATG